MKALLIIVLGLIGTEAFAQDQAASASLHVAAQKGLCYTLKGYQQQKACYDIYYQNKDSKAAQVYKAAHAKTKQERQDMMWQLTQLRASKGTCWKFQNQLWASRCYDHYSVIPEFSDTAFAKRRRELNEQARVAAGTPKGDAIIGDVKISYEEASDR